MTLDISDLGLHFLCMVLTLPWIYQFIWNFLDAWRSAGTGPWNIHQLYYYLFLLCSDGTYLGTI